MSRLEVVAGLLSSDPRARGRVLDAGTGGGYMTAILAGFRPVSLVSVSVDETSFTEARGRLPAGAEGRVRFVLGDVADPSLATELLPEGGFDLVVGDYLLAAVAGHRPFREIDVIVRLARLLAPDGLLVLTGMQPFEPCRTPEQEAVRAVLRWWAALTYLGGEEMYRELPAWWVADRLRERGLVVEETLLSEPLVWSIAQLRRLAESAAARAGSAGDARLAAFARRHLDALLRRAARLPGFAAGARRVAWSRDWVIRATVPE